MCLARLKQDLTLLDMLLGSKASQQAMSRSHIDGLSSRIVFPIPVSLRTPHLTNYDLAQVLVVPSSSFWMYAYISEERHKKMDYRTSTSTSLGTMERPVHLLTIR